MREEKITYTFNATFPTSETDRIRIHIRINSNSTYIRVEIKFGLDKNCKLQVGIIIHLVYVNVV